MAPGDEWKKMNSTFLTLRVTNKSDIPAALDEMAKVHSMTRSECIRMIIIKRLQEDGFWILNRIIPKA